MKAKEKQRREIEGEEREKQRGKRERKGEWIERER